MAGRDGETSDGAVADETEAARFAALFKQFLEP